MSQRFRKSERGQSLSELALSFTFLIVLIGGIIELGMMFYTMVSLRDSAQEGALYAAINPLDSAGVAERVRTSASFPLDSTQIGTVSVLCNGTGCFASSENSCQGQEVTVKISYNYRTTTPMLRYQSVIPLESSVTYTILQSDAREDYLAKHPLEPDCP